MDNEVESTKKKLSQNIQALIGEIGEKQVLLRLSILTHQTKWEVFHNLGEAGYDILLLNAETGERIKIEVKTRQRLYATGKVRRRALFFLTNGEYLACDFLVAYFIDNNTFYVIPKKDLRQTIVNGIVRWRFSLPLYKENEQYREKQKYLDAWNELHPDFRSEG